MKHLVTIIVALLLAFPIANAYACGDSLYRVGKGVSYRVYTAPLPGNVLVYGHSEGAQQLAEALAESGHNVEYVDTEVDLSLQAERKDYDVVIASFKDQYMVKSAFADSQETSFLPVAQNKAEAKFAEQSYERVMVADRDEIKNYLKAIHKTLKSRT